ncbi:MAG: ATP-binding cassette domain-containing protein [Halobacteriota archaeon]|nr:ATP-binding cassette domain-containing protein [Halobacteriota archaeon]
MAKADAILEVKGLTKGYNLSDGGHTLALKNVSFEVFLNETIGIIGKSGAGKTTLLRILRGVEPFDEGDIFIDGVRLTPESSNIDIAQVKEKTAIHLQRSFGLWAANTVENVMRRVQAFEMGDETAPLPDEGDAKFEDLRKKSMKYLELVGLTHKAEQAAHTLSGGEKQRLVLARQLVMQPRLLLLDEPLTMASPEDKKEALKVMKRIREELNITTLLVSHLPEIHRELSDRLLWIDNGELKEGGSTEEIISKFLSDIEEPIPVKPLTDKRPIFRLDGVSRTYYHYNLSKLFELKDINLDVYRGEIFGIIGPCGVGKTVLVRMLAGLEMPNKGNIIYFKEDGGAVDMANLGIESALIRQKLGILHQEFGLTHHAKVEDIIISRSRFKSIPEDELTDIARRLEIKESVLDFVLRLADVPESSRKDALETLEISEDLLLDIYTELPRVRLDTDEVQPILELLDLERDIINNRSYELSGGEKIRVALAVELATKPMLLILDEPFGDLDPVTAQKVANLLKKVNAELGTTFVIVSHDRELLASTAHRIALIEDGAVKGEFEKGRLHNL